MMLDPRRVRLHSRDRKIADDPGPAWNAVESAPPKRWPLPWRTKEHLGRLDELIGERTGQDSM